MTPTQDELLTAARRGDNEAFNRLVAPHRVNLYAHCYRMLGSATDAEDALQDVLVKAWRAFGGFRGQSSVRTWLTRIATNECLKVIERRSKRILPVDYGPAADPHDALGAPLVESVWVQPIPTADLPVEQREGVELAFIAALQHLTARQRATLLLHDVLGFSATETADMLDTSTTSVQSALQRAHKTVDQKLSGGRDLGSARQVTDDSLGQLVERYVEAWERQDVDQLVSLLTDDVKFAMPPLVAWFDGRAAVAEFFRLRPMRAQLHWRVTPTEANGQPAFAHYLLDPGTGDYNAHGITVLTIRDGRIAEMTGFLFPDLFPVFGLAMRTSA
jgi:RNA polymerase sigma-70 factor (ECF subfamily)